MTLANTYKSGAEGALDNLLVSAARTTSGNSAQIFSFGPITGLVIQVKVSFVNGTSPTLVVSLQDTVDDGATWNDVPGAITGTINSVSTTVIRLNTVNTPVSERMRISYTIGGTTPSFTFKVDSYILRA